MGNSDHHNTRGIALADRGWLEEAAKEFKKAIAANPDSSHAHDNLATVLAEQGDLLAALIEYVEAVKADPTCPTAHHCLASFLAGQGPELAITQYHKALELEDDFPDAHLNLAMALAEKGDFLKALNELNIAHAQAPEDIVIHHELACCLIDLRQYPGAIDHLKSILLREPEHLEATMDLGIAYTAQGLYTEAEKTLLNAITLEQENAAAHYHLASLYAAWERYEPAVECLEVAAKIDAKLIYTWLQHDSLFIPLQNSSRYIDLVRQLENDESK